MKRYLKFCAVTAMFCAAAGFAQDGPNRPPSPTPSGDYASDIGTVSEAEGEALQQAKAALEQAEDAGTQSALQTAIQEMEKAHAALDAAKSSPEKLGAALTAEQAAYQALLKATPREFRVSRSRNNQGGGGSGQPTPRELDQLQMKNEQNRYETESQASAAQTQQQREQSEIANRLKELAQRQQDLNDRLRELQSALQAARTDQEREDIQRQLKRLRDEERQMLSDVDELQQRMEQSPNASSMSDARQQLDQTRQDVQQAAQNIERNSPSQALASGTRAQEGLQNLREDLRKQTSSQFSDQMRQLRSQARDLAKQEEDIAKKMDSLQNGDRKSLDDSAQTQQLADQLTKQQSALTNLLSGMRTVSEQSENIEPLLSQKLYDTLRRADQGHTDNLLQMCAELAQRGFLPQAGEAERSARTNIDQLRQGVESAAESVLGNEAEALRYAQNELDDLTRQVEREIRGSGTNESQMAGVGGAGQSNRLANATGQGRGQNSLNREGTNGTATAANGRAENRELQSEQSGQSGQQANNNSSGNQNGSQRGSQNGGRNSANQQGERQSGTQGEQASAQNGQSGQQEGQGDMSGNAGAQNRGQGNSGDQANNNSSGDQNGSQGGGANQAQNGRVGGGLSDRQRLTQLARQFGGGGGGDEYDGLNYGGPITGGDYLNWADRLRDVEQVLDSPDLRYQLAAVRERASVLRQQYRQNGRVPDQNIVRQQILVPMTQVRVWLQEELARQQNANSLVPLDRDPVPDNYSELVRKYYEKLGSAQ